MFWLTTRLGPHVATCGGVQLSPTLTFWGGRGRQKWASLWETTASVRQSAIRARILAVLLFLDLCDRARDASNWERKELLYIRIQAMRRCSATYLYKEANAEALLENSIATLVQACVCVLISPQSRKISLRKSNIETTAGNIRNLCCVQCQHRHKIISLTDHVHLKYRTRCYGVTQTAVQLQSGWDRTV